MQSLYSRAGSLRAGKLRGPTTPTGNDVTLPSLAALIRAHRRAARVTLRELADASGVSVRAISDMERGQSAAQQRTLDALADALRLDAADRSTLAAAAGAVRSAPDGWGALPRDVPDFTGRSAEVDVLLRCLRDAARVVVYGPPGVGKTALAVHVAARFPGDVLFLDRRSTVPGPDPGDPAVRLRRAGGARTGSRKLVVVDDVADDRQLEPLLAHVDGAAVVVTSRCPLPHTDAAVRVPLPPLPAGESVALLSAITRTTSSRATLAVAGHCGHLPLALRIAGNRLAGRPGWTMEHLADRLADEDRRLPTLSAGDLSIEAALAPSFARLSEPARCLSRHLAAAPTRDFDARCAADLGGVTVASAQAGLDELVHTGLLPPPDDAGQHRFHDLVRLYATTTGSIGSPLSRLST